jgi:KDO2-lipid IV(A) lauroyltransferase
MFILYALGDTVGFFLFTVAGYRKEVVMKNLRHSFPNKSEAELQKIAAKFFRNFMDTWMETIKFLTISPKGLHRRMTGDNALLMQYYSQGKSCQLLGGHTMNWELLNGYFPLTQPLQFIAVYMQISNPAMERIFLKLRGRFGTILIPARHIREGVEKHFQQQYLYILGADQSPTKPAQTYWLNFLNQPTAFAMGPGKHSKKQMQPVVFGWVEKVSRGKYVAHVEELFGSVEDVSPEEITIAYVRSLERVINLHPDNYLWTHKRWKHSWKPEYAENWIDTMPMPAPASA